MEASKKSSTPGNIGAKLWELFGSLKFTLFILLSLAIVSVIGTVIQQNQPPQFYLQEYGKWASLISSIGLEDMYHTWWFLVLLVLLVVNIVVCTIDRFPTKWKTTLEGKVDVDPRFIKNLLNHHVIVFQGEAAPVKEKIVNILTKKRYKIKEAAGAEGVSMYAWKGVIGKFGSDVVHVSLLLILFGAILGSGIGFKDFGVFYEGEFVTVPEVSTKFKIDRSWHGIPIPVLEQEKKASTIQLRLDKFWVDYYESGMPKQYNSVLTLSDGGQEVIKGKQIWVNAPLSYKGITFYQSNYGTAYDKIGEAEFFLKDGKTKKTVVEPFTVEWDKPYNIPGTDYTIRVVGFVADFGFDPTTKTVFTKSDEHNNPAVRVEVYKAGRMISTPWLFYNYADLFSQIPDSDYELVFRGYKGIVYSGLSINRDPGTNIVWAGAVLMAIGFFMAFFVFHKRIWVNVRQNSNETEVHIGGMINKNKFVFEKELAEIVESLQEKKKQA